MLMLTEPLAQWDRFVTKGTGSLAAMDAYRQGDVITVQFDLPGVDASSIDVQIERGELRVTAQRQVTLPEGARYFVRERSDATISRRVLLGDVLDVDNVVADYAAGVLTLRIPLHQQAKARKVTVHTSEPVESTAALTVDHA